MSSAAPDRLRDGRDIAAVLRGRRQRSGRLLAVHLRPRDDQGPARVACVASRRVGSAVARNRSKRLLREATRAVLLPPGCDVVLVARAACARGDLSSVIADLSGALDELGLARESA